MYAKELKRKVLLKKMTEKEEKGTVTLHKASKKSISLYTVFSHIIGHCPGSCRMQLAFQAKIYASLKIHQNCVHLLQPQAGAWVYLEVVDSITM